MKQLLLCLAMAVATESVVAEEPPASLLNVPYVEHGTSDQTMDVFWPAAHPAAAVLFIHGGSLQEAGERRASEPYRHVCEPFVRAGFACASMDYRLAPKSRWPAMPNDVAAAVASLRRMLSARGADPAKVFLFGHSSGCLLAAIVGNNPAYLRTAGLAPADVAGVIAMGCTLDREDAALRGLTADRIRAAFMGDADEVATFGTPEEWLSANPASFAGPQSPPALVVVARAERFAPPVLEQASRFVRLLRESGGHGEVLIVPGKHMTSIANLGTANDPTFPAIVKFMANPRAAGDE